MPWAHPLCLWPGVHPRNGSGEGHRMPGLCLLMLPAHSWALHQACHLAFHVNFVQVGQRMGGVWTGTLGQGQPGRNSGRRETGTWPRSQVSSALSSHQCPGSVGKTQIVKTLASQAPFLIFGHGSLASIGRTSFFKCPTYSYTSPRGSVCSQGFG